MFDYALKQWARPASANFKEAEGGNLVQSITTRSTSFCFFFPPSPPYCLETAVHHVEFADLISLFFCHCLKTGGNTWAVCMWLVQMWGNKRLKSFGKTFLGKSKSANLPVLRQIELTPKSFQHRMRGIVWTLSTWLRRAWWGGIYLARLGASWPSFELAFWRGLFWSMKVNDYEPDSLVSPIYLHG